MPSMIKHIRVLAKRKSVAIKEHDKRLLILKLISLVIFVHFYELSRC